MDSHVAESSTSSYKLERKDFEFDNTNGDVSHQSGDTPYPEMTKEHLLRHSSKPFWKTLRTISIVLIILCWLCLIAATIAIIVIHPRCKQTPRVTWWQTSAVYRLYVRSFQDSDGDGIGDLKGVTSRLGYLKDLGVGSISLSPFYEYNENEFSVLNHTVVDKEYGTMEDFQELVAEVHKQDMRLIVDFIPGTTSSQHMWFTESASSGSRNNSYRNFYVWEDGSQAPNNWLTIYSRQGGHLPAWTRRSPRNQWYLHQLLDSQPSLNLRNYRIQRELEDILKFWIDNGADGFFVRNSAYLFADMDLQDEEFLPEPPSNHPDDYHSYKHEHTFGLPEINDMFARWRHLLDTYVNTDNTERFLMADIQGSIEQTMSYYGRFGRDGVDISLNYNLIPITSGCNGTCVKKHLDSWLGNIPTNKWQTWMIGTENTPRVQGRMNSTLTRPLTMLTMLLPGTPVVYYGDEIGMSDIARPPSERWSMDQPMRSPMQWCNATDGGFVVNCSTTAGSPWLPLHPDSDEINVEAQTNQTVSELEFFRALTALRQNPSIQYGDFTYVITNDNLVSFRREFDGQSTYLVAINFGPEVVTQDFRPSDQVSEAVVEAVTHPTGTLKVAETVDLSSIELPPREGVILSWDYQIKQY